MVVAYDKDGWFNTGDLVDYKNENYHICHEPR